MYSLNTFSISGLLIVAAYLPLLFFILKKKQSLITIIYSLHILSIILWGAGSFLVGITKDQQIVLEIWKYSYIAVLLIPVFFYHTTYLVTKKNNIFILLLVYGQVIYFIYIVLINKMFLGTTLVFNQFYWTQNSQFHLASFAIWEAVVLFAHLELQYFIRSKDNAARASILTMIFSGVGFIGGTNNFLLGYYNQMYPFGNFLIPIHSFGILYAIIKYGLFDINFSFKRSVVYGILFTGSTIFYLITVVVLEKVIQSLFNYKSSLTSVVVAFFIGLFFHPLKDFIQKMLDKYFLGSSPIEILDENIKLRKEVSATEKLKSIALIASGMAHEIKNPITTINTFAEYLPSKQGDIQFLNKCRKTLLHESARIQSLLCQLLSYAKPTLPNFESVNPQDILEEILILIEHKCLKQHIEIKKAYSANQTILADPNQLKQAFLNIIINAIESMPKSGTLTIETAVSKNTYTVSIKDTGAGIPKEDLSKIFTPFYTNKEGGTGLGLSITQGIIKDHGGLISIESNLQRGTFFKIELPIKA